MSYNFKDHGVWREYKPNPAPDWAIEMTEAGHPPVFLARESDKADWYAYRNAPGTFANDAIVACTLKSAATGQETVKSVFRDASMAFPINQRLIEVAGIDPADTKPHKLLTEMVYDPATHTVSGEPGLKFAQVTLKRDLWSRTTDSEVDAIEAWLIKQTNRKQRLFDDVGGFNHAEPLYADLVEAFSELFGPARAAVLLKAS